MEETTIEIDTINEIGEKIKQHIKGFKIVETVEMFDTYKEVVNKFERFERDLKGVETNIENAKTMVCFLNGMLQDNIEIEHRTYVLKTMFAQRYLTEKAKKSATEIMTEMVIDNAAMINHLQLQKDDIKSAYDFVKPNADIAKKRILQEEVENKKDERKSHKSKSQHNEQEEVKNETKDLHRDELKNDSN